MDATFGAGNFTKAILDSAKCSVIAIDQDPNTKEYANKISREYGDRFTFYNMNFKDLINVINIPVDGIVFDIGVSSMQLSNPQREFSFDRDGPLDMRMNNSDSCNTITARQLIDSIQEEELANIIYKYGNER